MTSCKPVSFSRRTLHHRVRRKGLEGEGDNEQEFKKYMYFLKALICCLRFLVIAQIDREGENTVRERSV